MDPTLTHGLFYGKTLRRCETAGLVLTETAYSPGARIPRHSHEHAYFCLILQGSYSEKFGRDDRECEPFTLAFHPAGELHSERLHRRAVRSFNVEAEPGWSDRVSRHSRLLHGPAEFHGGPLSSLAMKMYAEFCRMDDLSPLTLEGLAFEVVAEASRQRQPRGDAKRAVWLERVKELLHSRFAENLTLGEIARIAGVHPVHLASEFRRTNRCTVGQYVRRLRVESACRTMTTSDIPLAELAVASGFCDQSHFSRTFKQLVGMSPARYRANLRRH